MSALQLLKKKLLSQKQATPQQQQMITKDPEITALKPLVTQSIVKPADPAIPIHSIDKPVAEVDKKNVLMEKMRLLLKQASKPQHTEKNQQPITNPPKIVQQNISIQKESKIEKQAVNQQHNVEQKKIIAQSPIQQISEKKQDVQVQAESIIQQINNNDNIENQQKPFLRPNKIDQKEQQIVVQQIIQNDQQEQQQDIISQEKEAIHQDSQQIQSSSKMQQEEGEQDNQPSQNNEIQEEVKSQNENEQALPEDIAEKNENIQPNIINQSESNHYKENIQEQKQIQPIKLSQSVLEEHIYKQAVQENQEKIIQQQVEQSELINIEAEKVLIDDSKDKQEVQNVAPKNQAHQVIEIPVQPPTQIKPIEEVIDKTVVTPAAPNKMQLMLQKMKKMKSMEKPIESKPQQTTNIKIKSFIEEKNPEAPLQQPKKVQILQQIKQAQPLNVCITEEQVRQQNKNDEDSEGYQSGIVEESIEDEQGQCQSVQQQNIMIDEAQQPEEIEAEIEKEDIELIHKVQTKKQQKRHKILLKQMLNILNAAKNLKDILISKHNYNPSEKSSSSNLREIIGSLSKKLHL